MDKKEDFAQFTIGVDELRLGTIIDVLNQNIASMYTYHLFAHDDDKYRLILTAGKYVVVTETGLKDRLDMFEFLSKELACVIGGMDIRS